MSNFFNSNLSHENQSGCQIWHHHDWRPRLSSLSQTIPTKTDILPQLPAITHRKTCKTTLRNETIFFAAAPKFGYLSSLLHVYKERERVRGLSIRVLEERFSYVGRGESVLYGQGDRLCRFLCVQWKERFERDWKMKDSSFSKKRGEKLFYLCTMCSMKNIFLKLKLGRRLE